MKNFAVGLLLATLFAASLYGGQAPATGRSPQHIASPEEVRAAALAGPAGRGAGLEKIDGILDSATGREILSRWRISAAKAKAAVRALDDDEIASLAARADGVMAGLQGGESMRTIHTIYLVGMITLAALVVAVLLI
ncbi:MAG TPA: hypothetical protein VLN41_01440 [Candidatus Bathyarchaeia archaeon]|nr:hypothetical protein [Candidatus Bathyarchaeia archaeon]